jgi:hypothetical protein
VPIFNPVYYVYTRFASLVLANLFLGINSFNNVVNLLGGFGLYLYDSTGAFFTSLIQAGINFVMTNTSPNGEFVWIATDSLGGQGTMTLSAAAGQSYLTVDNFTVNNIFIVNSPTQYLATVTLAQGNLLEFQNVGNFYTSTMNQVGTALVFNCDDSLQVWGLNFSSINTELMEFSYLQNTSYVNMVVPIISAQTGVVLQSGGYLELRNSSNSNITQILLSGTQIQIGANTSGSVNSVRFTTNVTTLPSGTSSAYATTLSLGNSGETIFLNSSNTLMGGFSFYNQTSTNGAVRYARIPLTLLPTNDNSVYLATTQWVQTVVAALPDPLFTATSANQNYFLPLVGNSFTSAQPQFVSSFVTVNPGTQALSLYGQIRFYQGTTYNLIFTNPTNLYLTLKSFSNGIHLEPGNNYQLPVGVSSGVGGLYVGWNGNGGFDGETDFINQGGTGSGGGFRFYCQSTSLSTTLVGYLPYNPYSIPFNDDSTIIPTTHWVLGAIGAYPIVAQTTTFTATSANTPYYIPLITGNTTGNYAQFVSNLIQAIPQAQTFIINGSLRLAQGANFSTIYTDPTTLYLTLLGTGIALDPGQSFVLPGASTARGLVVGWNSTGFGRTEFVNASQFGPGGFNFYNKNSTTASTLIGILPPDPLTLPFNDDSLNIATTHFVQGAITNAVVPSASIHVTNTTSVAPYNLMMISSATTGDYPAYVNGFVSLNPGSPQMDVTGNLFVRNYPLRLYQGVNFNQIQTLAGSNLLEILSSRGVVMNLGNYTLPVGTSPLNGLQIGWNASGGEGEVDLLCNGDGGGNPGFNFYAQSGTVSTTLQATIRTQAPVIGVNTKQLVTTTYLNTFVSLITAGCGYNDGGLGGGGDFFISPTFTSTGWNQYGYGAYDITLYATGGHTFRVMTLTATLGTYSFQREVLATSYPDYYGTYPNYTGARLYLNSYSGISGGGAAGPVDFNWSISCALTT